MLVDNCRGDRIAAYVPFSFDAFAFFGLAERSAHEIELIDQVWDLGVGEKKGGDVSQRSDGKNGDFVRLCPNLVS